MKNLSFILICLYLGITAVNAQKVNVDLTVKFNGAIKSDSIYLFFYPTTSVELEQALPIPEKQFVFHNLSNKFQLYPGAYTMVGMAFGYIYLFTRIYIPPSSDFNMEITFNPSIIGWGGVSEIEQINEVTLRGDFNAYGKNGEIPLTKKGNVWKLDEKPDVLKGAKEYTFFVNGQETTDLLNSKVKPLAAWHVFKNIYSNNELVFNPSLYSLVFKESEIKVKDTLQQYHFKRLINDINALEKEKNEIFKKATSREAALPLFDTLIAKYSEIENKYPQDISQIIFEKELGPRIIKSLYIDAPQGNSNDLATRDKRKEYFLGEEFRASFTKINELANSLDPHSFLLTAELVSNFFMLQSLLEEFPELATQNNLSEKNYFEFIDNFIAESPNKKLCYSMILQMVYMNKRNNEEKAIELLNELKNAPEYAEFINNDQIDNLMNGMNVTLGKIAPNFTVDLLNGKKISLDDFKGKFVFIDFWGSWCGPCRQEIPNIKKLYNSLSRDKLEIIGLAQDDETKLRDYIQEQKIEYPNALAPNDLLKKYGISKYPTSYLLNPKGRIVKMDVRGADAMELIKNEIEDYFN